MIKNRHIAILVMLMFAFTMLSPAAYAGNFNDISGHWGEDQIKTMLDDGIISGYPDGTFKPDGKITRAEFASLLVTGFKLTKSEGKSFADTSDHWGKDAIATASAAGIVSGYSDTSFGPDDPITREQMAVMTIKAAQLTDAANAKTFADNSSISAWAQKAVAIATANQVITGYPDNTFQPQGNATRAEAAVVLSKSLITVSSPVKSDYSSIEKAGTYGPETGSETVNGDVTVKARDTILQNLIVKGDLIIADEVGNGNVTLNNIKVEGKTYIRGGGIDSIHINGGEYSEIVIERTISGAVRIVAINAQGLPITIAENDNGEEIILNGDIKSVTVKADNVKITTQGETTIGELKVVSGLKNVNLELAKGTTVKEMVLDSKTDVTGEGETDKASGSKAKESTFATPPAIITTPSTGGGGGSSGSTTTIPISAISVTGQGGATEITTDGGTLQMLATVSPSNASNKNVDWSVDKPGIATIDGNGKLTAKTNGTVRVTATAKDGSGKKGIATIYISGQIVITNVTISPKTALVQKGMDETFTATVAGTGAFDSTVTWSVSGGASGTTIDTDGKLTVDASETATTLTVTATANGDNSKSDSATVTVTDKEVFEVTFDPGEGTGSMAPVKVISGEKFTLPVPEFTAPEHKRFSFWEVGTILYIAGAEVEITESIKIKALWNYKAVEIRNAPTKVLPGQSYNLTIYMDNILQTGEKVKEEVDFSIDGNTATSSGTTVSENGYLTVAIDETVEQFTLRASKKGTTMIYDEVTISVQHGDALIIKASDPTTSGEIEQALDDQGYYWKKDTKTLEIKDLNINEIGYGIVFSGFGYSDTINLQLHGTNKINIASGGITQVKGITYKTGNGGNLIIDGNGSLEIIMPDLGNTGTSYGIDLHSLIVKGKAKLKVTCKKAFSAYGIKTQNDTIFEGNAKVEVESHGTVIGAFGNNGNIYIKENTEFKGIGSGIYPILNAKGDTDNGNIVFEKDTIIELIRINQPNSSGDPKFFDYNGVLTLETGLELQGSENINGSSLAEAQLTSDTPAKVVNMSNEDKFKYLLIEPQLTDEEKVARAIAKLDIGDLSAVVADLTLPATQNGATVTWSSSDTDVITDDGKVTRPEKGSEDATVTLTATLTLGSASDTKAFEVTVKAETINKIKTVTINGFVGAETDNKPIKISDLETTDTSYEIVGLTWYEWDSVEDKEEKFTGTKFKDVSRYYYSAIIELNVKDDYHFVPKDPGQTQLDINTVPSDWDMFISGMSTWEKLIIYIDNPKIPR